MTESTQNLRQRVEASLDTMRPYLQNDGGDVQIVEITDEMIVKLRLMGNCDGCPQSFMTMKAGIENAIMSAVPAIKGVIAVN